MGIEVASQDYNSIQFLDKELASTNPMSQDYHQAGIYSFSNEFERSQQEQQQQQQQQQQHHIAQQIRRDKLRIQGFDPPPHHLVGIEEKESGVGLPVYETVGMLSEMFGFPSGGGVPTATELLESQISQTYRNQRPPPTGAADNWFLHRQGMVVGGGLGDSKNQISSMNEDPAAAMQLFLMNSQQQRSPSPSSSHQHHHHHHHHHTSSTLHMLLPNHSSSPNSSNLQTFHPAPAAAFGQFTWVPNSEDESNPNEIPGVMEGQALSLSLSSSLQHLEAVKAEELRMREGGMLCFGQGGGGPSTSSVQQYQFKNLNAAAAAAAAASPLHLQGGVVGQNHQLQVGSSFGAVNILRNSKYAKAAQELLEEFCSVGRGQFKKNKHNNNNTNSNPGGGGGVNSSSSSAKDLPPLSAADRLEHQRRKVKLLSMLDEVDRRYSHYCEQMQMVVNSFDMVMGFGSAVPYTCLAQKAMSRHFRCLKDSITAQLKHTCELLGEKDGGGSSSGITKGETPRLKILEQSLRQQRAFHQMGMMQQEAWRPQRGLPDRSVNILRAWLFEHFLHPYPSDADKHLLARQTGLSRNQVSNWFINARVRLWKPMVEEMYQQEAKDEERDHSGSSSSSAAAAAAAGTNSNNAQTSTPHATTTTAITPTLPATKKSSHEINAPESDPSFIAINSRQRFSENQATIIHTNNNAASSAAQSFPAMHETDSGRMSTLHAPQPNESSTLIRFGANAGDVSLTLGLRHAGNLPEQSRFSIRDFGG
ncbi:BEL1-like homeodomain protein 2 [Henckelia pumila]|uniref:BEL1-like homeodomain protein 2 n=1 Tax=Henckelia pumila TaxID=405737 RepID=UPI003C6DE167